MSTPSAGGPDDAQRAPSDPFEYASREALAAELQLVIAERDRLLAELAEAEAELSALRSAVERLGAELERRRDPAGDDGRQPGTLDDDDWRRLLA